VGFTRILAVLFAFIALLQLAAFCIEVMVIVVGDTPPLARGTAKVPVPGLPAVKLIDAVLPVAALGADELYTTVYVPVKRVFDCIVTVDEPPDEIGDVALKRVKSETNGKGFTVIASVLDVPGPQMLFGVTVNVPDVAELEKLMVTELVVPVIVAPVPS